jgi:pimeloyl-ACP methyl ester carboxylesterase
MLRQSQACVSIKCWQYSLSCAVTEKLDSASFALWLHTALVPSSGKHVQIWLARSLHGSPHPPIAVRVSTDADSSKSLTTRNVMTGGDLTRNTLAHGRNPLLAAAMRYVWLHGFASGPDSTKGRFVRDRLAERGRRLEIPDLNQPAFRDLTVTRSLEHVDELLRGDRVVLFGSSLGGYTAALWSARRPGRAAALVLLAPAFDLAARWKERTAEDELRRWRARGEVLVDHYAWGHKEPLSIRFLDDAERHEPFPLPDAPTLVLQGSRDDVVAPQLAREFARRMRGAGREVSLVELDEGHELTADLPRLWREIEAHVPLS